MRQRRVTTYASARDLPPSNSDDCDNCDGSEAQLARSTRLLHMEGVVGFGLKISRFAPVGCIFQKRANPHVRIMAPAGRLVGRAEPGSAGENSKS